MPVKPTGRAAACPYRAPRWLPGRGALGGHAHTIWPAFFSAGSRGGPPGYQRQRWTTPDGDFIDVDWQEEKKSPGATTASPVPLLVLFHGLEGNSGSHYAQAFAGAARAQGWRYAVPHFRGCSGELNLAPRSYHSGDHEEVAWMLSRLRAAHAGPLVAVGISLGGNALLRWAEENGGEAARLVSAVAAVSAPLDLAASAWALGRGFSRASYARAFLKGLKPKALAKLDQYPGLFDRQRLLAARTLYEFDDVATGPIHGFSGADDYYARASAKPWLSRIRLPTLVLNARNDPFVPGACLPTAQGLAGADVTLWQPPHGGHVGFPAGPWPGHLLCLPQMVMAWMRTRADLGPAIAQENEGACPHDDDDDPR